MTNAPERGGEGPSGMLPSTPRKITRLSAGCRPANAEDDSTESHRRENGGVWGKLATSDTRGSNLYSRSDGDCAQSVHRTKTVKIHGNWPGDLYWHRRRSAGAFIRLARGNAKLERGPYREATGESDKTHDACLQNETSWRACSFIRVLGHDWCSSIELR